MFCQKSKQNVFLYSFLLIILDKCVYLAWTSWSSCQGHCGNRYQNGTQFRQRLPLHVLTGSHLCETQKEYRSCQTSPCFGLCILSPWSRWSPCSKSCNLGYQKRSRYYLSLQPNCTDNLVEKRDCNPQCCPSGSLKLILKRNSSSVSSEGKRSSWSEWSSWGNCSRVCNGGERMRYRTCKMQTDQCQQQIPCVGSDRQIEPCNTEKCRK